jgi:uncharacterized membrane protein YhaH (DUF805 family)
MDAMRDATTQSGTGPTTRNREWDTRRLAAGAGFGFVAALVAGLVTLPADDAGLSAADIAARYGDGSAAYLRFAVLEGFGVALFVVFAGALTAVLDRAGPGRSSLAAVATTGAAVAAALQLSGYALIATLAYGTAAGGDGDVVLAVYDLSSAVFTFAMFGLTVFFAATAVSIRRTRALGRTVGWAAAVTAVVTLVAAGSVAREGAVGLHGDLGFIAIVLAHVWALAASIALLRRPAGK